MRKILRLLIILICAMILVVFGGSAYVSLSSGRDIVVSYDGAEISEEDISGLKEIDPQCILVLGCAVWLDNEPSPMLRDRLDTAIALYNAGVAPKLLFSGDNSIAEYSEPDCMLQYALAKGVPAEDIFLDFAGFSTYESMYRARDVFCVDRAVVVTQRYHLFRSLNICRALGIEARGAGADQQKYSGQLYRELREILARDKDLVKGIYKPEPTFLGDKIPIDGDGTQTHLN